MQELLKEESDKEIVDMANEDMTRLLEEEKRIAEEAHQISLPSNLYRSSPLSIAGKTRRTARSRCVQAREALRRVSSPRTSSTCTRATAD